MVIKWKEVDSQSGYSDTIVSVLESTFLDDAYQAKIAKSKKSVPWEIWINGLWRDCYFTKEDAQKVAKELLEEMIRKDELSSTI